MIYFSRLSFIYKIQETHVEASHLPLQPNVIDIRPTRAHLPPKELKIHDRTASLPSGVPGGNFTSDTEGALLREAVRPFLLLL